MRGTPEWRQLPPGRVRSSLQEAAHIAAPPRVARAAAIGAIGLIGFVMAGCSSGGTGQSIATTTAPASRAAHSASAGATYLADVGPADAALGAFTARSRMWTTSTSIAQAESDAAPAVAALQTFDAALREQSWPPGTASGVQMLLSDDAAVVGDLQGIAMMDHLNPSTWMQRFTQDLRTDSSAAALVRRELGLPPASPIG